MSRPVVQIRHHAVIRWQQRISNVDYDLAIVEMIEALAGAKAKHFKPHKLKQKTFYIPTPKAQFIGGYGIIRTVIGRTRPPGTEQEQNPQV